MSLTDTDFVIRNPGAFAWVLTNEPEPGSSGESQWVLAELLPTRDARPGRSYRPFRDYTGLFMAFAETSPTRDGILAFAQRFGHLSRTFAIPGGGTPLDEAGRPTRPFGESFLLWRQQISDMRQACDLWIMCRSGDTAALANHILWERTPEDRFEVHYASHPELDSGDITPAGHRAERQLIASFTFHPERLEQFRHGDLFAPALTYVQEAVNARSEAMAFPRLLWDAESGGLQLKMVPRHLLGVLWFQFARAVSGGSDFRKCSQCDAWFELSPSTARTNRLFCSGACRGKGHRMKLARAVELHLQGKSFKEIAKEVDSDAATVRRWVKEKK